MTSRGPLSQKALRLAPQASSGGLADDMPEELVVERGNPWPVPVDLPASLEPLYKEITASLDKTGLLTPADVPALVLCLLSYQAAIEANREVRASGYSVTDDQGRVRMNPAVTAFNTASRQYLALANSLGMTVASRIRWVISAYEAQQDKQQTNPFAGG